VKPGDHPEFFRLAPPPGASRDSTISLDAEGRFFHDGARVEHAAREVAARLRRQARALQLADDAVLGPAPPPVERVRGRYRWQILLRAPDVRALRALARLAAACGPALGRAHVRLAVDVDPYSML